MEVIDVHDWDRAPAVQVLAGGLFSDPSLHGGGRLGPTLDEMSAAGLIEHDLADEQTSAVWTAVSKRFGAHGGVWSVKLTATGASLALLLAPSDVLVDALWAKIRGLCQGVAAWRIVRELDLRSGGDGRIADYVTWSQCHPLPELALLPRRQVFGRGNEDRIGDG